MTAMTTISSQEKGNELNKVRPLGTAKKSRLAILSRLAGYARPDFLHIFFGMSALAVNAVTNLSFPWIIGRALDNATEDLTAFLMKSGGFFLAGSLASWIRVYCLGTALEGSVRRLRADLFDSLLAQDMAFYESNMVGDMVGLLEEDTLTAGRSRMPCPFLSC